MSFFDNKYVTLTRDADLEAFYDVDIKHRRKIIFAHMMLHLLPVLIVVLSFWQLNGSQYVFYAVGISILLYISTIAETTFYLFPKTRQVYKKHFSWVIIFFATLGGIGGYQMARTGDPEISYWYYILGVAATVGVFLWAHLGLSHILHASRALYTRKAEMEADVRFAREVQERILKDVTLEYKGSRAYACSFPAHELGGDYFELSRNNNNLFAAIGDISGHSFGAGLLMTMTKSALHTHLEYSQDSSRIMKALNRLFLQQSDRAMFATMAFIQIDLAGQTARLCNAGHLPVLHYDNKNGQLNHRHIKGLGLGIHEKAEYSNLEFTVCRGDLLLLYSDGLTEIRDENLKVRDPDFFEQLVRKAVAQPYSSLKQLTQRILDSVRLHHHGERLEDDITLIVVEV